MSETNPASNEGCDNCGKSEAELSNPLKKCAKCQTGKYCSRDCQKADFKRHKKICRAPNSASSDGDIPGSLTNPPQSEILSAARRNTDLIGVLLKSPGVDRYLADPVANANVLSPILNHLISFCHSTHEDYWARLIPPQVGFEITASVARDPEKRLREAVEGFERMRRIKNSRGDAVSDINAWPKFDQTCYSDALRRNEMAKFVVADNSKQMMFGMPRGEVYVWTDEVKEEVKKQMGEKAWRKVRREN